jgi:hypothetical protein
MPKSNKKIGDFELWIGSGHLNAKCKDCGTSPILEYMGFDPVFPKFKLICNKCRTYDVMKVYLHCTKLYPIPYRGKKRFSSQFGGILPASGKLSAKG